MKKWTRELTRHVGHNVLVLLFAALAVFCAVMILVSTLAGMQEKGIAVKEPIVVSTSALDASDQNFVSQISGYLISYEDEKADIDRVVIVVGDGKERYEVELDGFTLSPRLSHEIFFEWKTSFYYDRVYSVTVYRDGYGLRLANSAAEWEFDPSILAYAVLCAIFAFVGVYFGKKRFYLWQEDQIKARG